eukprot:s4633_g6.t1
MLDPQPVSKEYANKLSTIPGVCVTDCRSLYDCLHSERTLLSDKRLSLEAAIIRQSLTENMEIHWVSTEQQLADCLTKTLGKKGLAYIQRVLQDNEWMLGPDPRVVIKRERLREEKAGKVSTPEESQAINGKYVKTKSKLSTNTIFVATVASCFTTVEGSADEDHRVFPTSWLMIVAVTAAVLFAGILCSYHLVQRRTLKLITLRVLEKFEQWSLISLATWFCTILAFAVGEFLEGKFSNSWQFAMYIIPTGIGCYYVKNYIDKRFVIMTQALREEHRSILKQVAEELKVQNELIKAESRALHNKLEGCRVYLKDAMDDFQGGMDYATQGIANNQRRLHEEITAAHGRSFRMLDETNSRVYAVQRGVRRLILDADLGTSSMGSDERRSVLRRRDDRRDIPGTPTDSPDVSIFSEDRPHDDHQAELDLLDALRNSNPDWDDEELLHYLTEGRDAAQDEHDLQTVREMQRMINLINFERPATEAEEEQ